MSELSEKIDYLLRQKFVTGYKMCQELGLSRSFMTELRKGRAKSINVTTAKKIADYFGVTVGYLLGDEQKENPAQKSEPEITLDDFTYAMQSETKELTESDKELLLSMARQLNEARKQRDGKAD